MTSQPASVARWIRIALLCVFLLTAAACGDPVPESAGAAAAGQGGGEASEGQTETVGDAEGAEVVLDFLWFTDGPDLQAIQDLVKRFSEEREGIAVNFLNIPYAGLDQRLQAQLAAGDPPDIARVTNVSIYRDALIDMRPHLSDPDGFVDQFLDQPMGPLVGENDEIYGLPHDFTMNGPLVNLDMFKKAGIEVPGADDEPWTWDELIENARAAQEEAGAPYAIAFDRSGHRFGTMLSQFGGGYFDDNGDVAFDSQETRAAVEQFVQLHEDGLMPLDVWLGSGDTYADAADFFISQQAPVYFAGNWVVAHFEETINDFKWAAMPNPCAENCGGYPGGKFLVAFEGTEHPEELAQLMEYLGDAEIMEEFSSRSLFLPTREDLVEQGVDYPSRQEDMNVFLADIPRLPEGAFIDQYHPAFGPVADEAVNNITRVLAGDANVEDAVQRTQNAGEKLLDELEN